MFSLKQYANCNKRQAFLIPVYAILTDDDIAVSKYNVFHVMEWV